MATHLRLLAIFHVLVCSASLCGQLLQSTLDIWGVLFVVGIASSGHVGFNEFASGLAAKAVMEYLFLVVLHVPLMAIAIGLWKNKRWARRASLLWAVFVAFVNPFTGCIQLLLLFWPEASVLITRVWS